MSSKELRTALLKILEKYPWKVIYARGLSGEDLLDGKTYSCFIRFFQDELSNFEQARHIIVALQKLFVSRHTSAEIKFNIQRMFELMNPRDQNYRFRENCDCETCVSPRQILSRLIKQK